MLILINTNNSNTETIFEPLIGARKIYDHNNLLSFFNCVIKFICIRLKRKRDFFDEEKVVFDAMFIYRRKVGRKIDDFEDNIDPENNLSPKLKLD